MCLSCSQWQHVSGDAGKVAQESEVRPQYQGLSSRACLQWNPKATESRRLCCTGHSLGAAMALLFAQAAHVQHPQLAARISAVYGFAGLAPPHCRAPGCRSIYSSLSSRHAPAVCMPVGKLQSKGHPVLDGLGGKRQEADKVCMCLAAPRVGDAAFAAACQAAYAGRIYHLVHGSDIVPRVPPKFLEYVHAGKERFITSFGRVLTDEADIRKWHRIEGAGFVPLYLYKVLAGIVVRGESLRTLYRIVLLIVLPGLADHWPSDYEVAVRKHLDQQHASNER